MKRLTAMFLTLLLLSLSACGTASQNQPGNTDSGNSQTEEPTVTDDGIETESGFPFTLTTKDGAWEATFDTDYQIYKDLTLAVELGYIHLSLNDGVWGNVLDNTNRNAYKASVNMRYAF